MSRVSIKPGTQYPAATGLYVLGSEHDGARSFLALSWCTRFSSSPKKALWVAGINRRHNTLAMIREVGTFSMSIVSPDWADKADAMGLKSSRAVDKASFVDGIEHTTMLNMPFPTEARVVMDCRLVDINEIEGVPNAMVTFEVVGAEAKEECVRNSVCTHEAVDPLVFLMGNDGNVYHRLDFSEGGSYVANAWSAGRAIVQAAEEK
ncbi:hypothetical protein PCE1_002893 [Barthelona sp. PCE]